MWNYTWCHFQMFDDWWLPWNDLNHDLKIPIWIIFIRFYFILSPYLDIEMRPLSQRLISGRWAKNGKNCAINMCVLVVRTSGWTITTKIKINVFKKISSLRQRHQGHYVHKFNKCWLFKCLGFDANSGFPKMHFFIF